MGLLEDPNLAKATFFVLPWKGYHTQEELEQFIKKVNEHSKSTAQKCLLAVPYPLLEKQATALSNPAFILGSTAMGSSLPGSFTDSIAAKVLQQKKARFVLIGTEENRELRNETNEQINHKIKKALENDITPFFCLGESLEELQEGKSAEVLKKQCEEGLAGLTLKQMARIAFVYEAPWVQKTSELVSMEKLIGHYFAFRQAVAEVVGPQVFPKIKFIDPFPNDMEHFSELLQSMGGKGLFISEPSLFFSLLDALKPLEGFNYPAEGMEPFSEEGLEEAPKPVAEKVTKEVTEEKAPFAKAAVEGPLEELHPGTETVAESVSEQTSPLKAVKKPIKKSLTEAPAKVVDKDLESSIEAVEEVIEETPTYAEAVVEKVIEDVPITPEEIAEKVLEDVIEEEEEHPMAAAAVEKPLEEVPSYAEEILEDNLEELTPSPEKEKPFTPLELAEEDLEKLQSSTVEEVGSELEEKVKNLRELNLSLAECYQEITKKADLLPKLRNTFPEKLSKMTADLNQLDPALQEEINRGNVAFFTENPDKAQEASGVLMQLQELNFLLQETTAIPRDIDRLISKSRQVRKQLEEAWEYFTKSRKEIKDKNPDFVFPPTPSQLSVKEPVIDLSPKESGPSPLVGKKVAVVRTPPLKK